jgi:hypothetical protein
MRRASEAVAKRCSGQEQAGEGEVVSVDDPLEVREAAAKVDAHDWRCRRDDQGVERGHEGPESCDREGRTWVRARHVDPPPPVVELGPPIGGLV